MSSEPGKRTGRQAGRQAGAALKRDDKGTAALTLGDRSGKPGSERFPPAQWNTLGRDLKYSERRIPRFLDLSGNFEDDLPKVTRTSKRGIGNWHYKTDYSSLSMTRKRCAYIRSNKRSPSRFVRPDQSDPRRIFDYPRTLEWKTLPVDG